MKIEDYIHKQKESGIKVGDRVIVTRKCESFEGGWSSSWATGMDKTVGNIYTVKIIHPTAAGIGLGNYDDSRWYYPYFVLRKVEDVVPIKKTSVKINGREFRISEAVARRLRI